LTLPGYVTERDDVRDTESSGSPITIRVTGRGWLLAGWDFQSWCGPRARLAGPRRLVLHAAWGSRSGVLRAPSRPGSITSMMWCPLTRPDARLVHVGKAAPDALAAAAVAAGPLPYWW